MSNAFQVYVRTVQSTDNLKSNTGNVHETLIKIAERRNARMRLQYINACRKNT